MKKHLPTKLWLLLTLAALTTGRLQAVDLHLLGSNMPSVDFHGFLSQGYLASSDYNYLGDTTGNGSLKFFETGVNASFNPFPRTRISAQGFSFDVGKAGGYDVVLDYAQAEYTFADWFGIRAGRIRRPEGLYNHIQDVDLARTWILLPQGMYNARWRDMYTSLDGGELFGNIGLGVAGSLDYELYDGLQRPQLNGGLALQKESLPPFLPLTWFNSPQIPGAQFWWNTPLSGLRAGAAVNSSLDFSFMNSSGRMSVGSPLVQRYSLEYLWKSWTFQGEYYTYSVDYHNSGGGLPSSVVHIQPDSWYFGPSYRVNKWLEVGGYYSEYYTSIHNRTGTGTAVPSDAYQKDAALTLRFDPTSWWILKVEGHYIMGTAQLSDNVTNPTRRGNGWFMGAVKTTFNF